MAKARRYRRRGPAYSEPFAACDRPNAVWCADFKGWFRTGNGERCNPLTVSDAYSRMLLCCKSLSRANYDKVRPALEAVFREFGLPDVIRTDNGAPFASIGAGGLSRLAVWWVKLGIQPERIEPGHPEQNGRHERMHLTLKQDCCQPPAATVPRQQRRFNEFVQVYNCERPHQALGLRPPATLYRPSQRPYPAKLEDPAYPPNTALRRVRTNGEIKWRGQLIFVSEALIRETVGVAESEHGHEVHFGPILLGLIDPLRERLIRPRMPSPPFKGVTHAHS
jgi:hypothetical protein